MTMHKLLMRAKAHPFVSAIGVLLLVGFVLGLSSAIAAVQRSAGSSGVALTNKSAGGAMGAPGFVIAYDDYAAEESAAARDAAMPMPPFEPTAGETAASVDQKIVRTAHMRVVVDDVNDSAKALSGYAESAGGFVEHSSVAENRDGTRSGSVILRVPVDRFDAALDRVREEANLVRQETVEGQDVTEQFTDLQAQLRNARSQETAFLSILAQARSVEDILKVQVQLGQIRERIEVLEGRIQYLENRTSFSTISVSLEEEAAIRVPTKEFRPLEAARAAVQTLFAAFQSIAIGIIWALIVGLGIGVPAALVLWLGWKLVGRFRK